MNHTFSSPFQIFIRTLLVVFGILVPLIFGEIFIQVYYNFPFVIYSDKSKTIEYNAWDYFRLGEIVGFKYKRGDYNIYVGKEDTTHSNDVILNNKDTGRDIYNITYDASKKNVAFIGDSVTFGWMGGMINDRFSTLLNKDLWKDGYRFFNLSDSALGVSEIFMQYEKYIKEYPVDTIIYVYTNQDIYPNKQINGKMYGSPFIVQSKHPIPDKIPGESLNILSDIFSSSNILKFIQSKFLNHKEQMGITSVLESGSLNYNKFLLKRFIDFTDLIQKETKLRKQRFIVIISPSIYFKKPPPAQSLYERIYEEDQYLYNSLRKNHIEVYNMYDYNIQNKDFFVDDCCHLNKAGHTYYADFIKTLVTGK